MTLNAETNSELFEMPLFRRWVMAARLTTLGLSVTPVLVGTWLAALSGIWRVDVLVTALVSAILIQIGTNLWNDAADGVSGVDGRNRLGPPRVTSLGLLGAQEVRTAAATVFLLAAVAGLYLVLVGGWPILAVGFASLALGYTYSMGPYPLSSTPIGEVLVVAFFGVAAVAGTAWLHGTAPTSEIWLAGLLFGLPAASVLLIDNHRDRKSDAAGGRKTLAILIGEPASKLFYSALNLTALIGLGLLYVSCINGLLVFSAMSIYCAYIVRRMWLLPVSRQLNSLLAQTALYQLMLFAASALAVAAC
jgi:1,4-dihydroxy-2-naphthoate octaprenyltransferase